MTFPLGPFHPALTEPISLQFALRGEMVTGVETHTGYLHRGVTTLATQSDLATTLDLVERLCGSCGHSHRLALCLALEAHAQIVPPPRAQAIRMLFAEVERALSRLWLLMQLGRISGIGTLFTAAVEAREMLFEGCVTATENRLFWGVAIPGGAVNVADPEAFADTVADVNARLVAVDRLFAANGALTQRTAGIGKIMPATAEELGLTGLVLRATGLDAADVRVTQPYEAYADFADALADDDTPTIPLFGDVASRARLALAELRVSLRLILAILDDLPTGQEQVTFPMTLAPGTVSATVEGPHGSETLTVTVGANINGGQLADLSRVGWLQSLTIQTPSATNIGIVPIVLHKQQLNDVPLVFASLDLCLACVDQ